MPELPEVEYAARHLRKWLEGRRIDRVEADPTRILRPQKPADIIKALEGRQLTALDRRAKYLLFTFDGDQGAVAHLGMTGKWLRRAPSDPPPNSRLRLFLDDGSVVHYRDPRMFGQFSVLPASKVPSFPAVAKLGPDPLADHLTAQVLGERLAKTGRPVKIALMDQTLIGGLGNIQAAEALWRARIDPHLSARKLSDAQLRDLTQAIHDSIQDALGAEDGEGEIEYVEEGGENPFSVYGRKGEPCRRCKTPIRTREQGGRTTFYCPQCQSASKAPASSKAGGEPARSPARPKPRAKAAPSRRKSNRS
jgi:formamidopyrimidine-DNA glycosylase